MQLSLLSLVPTYVLPPTTYYVRKLCILNRVCCPPSLPVLPSGVFGKRVFKAVAAVHAKLATNVVLRIVLLVRTYVSTCTLFG